MRNAHGTIHVGIDVSKDKLAVAIAGRERGDEVLSLGTFENTPASVDKLPKKLAGRGDISACYEAGPTGYGPLPANTRGRLQLLRYRAVLDPGQGWGAGQD